MPEPLVSIIIPSLNRAHFLAPTIESILGQNYPAIECIVVDGGSKDETLEILKRYEGRIAWIQEPDKCHADAINKGWKMSRGDILAWLNADDCYVVPDAISQTVDYFQTHPDVDVVYGNFAVMAEDGRAISPVLSPRKWDLEYAVKYCFYTITQPASFMRRTILEKVGWLNSESYNDDHDLWLRIGLVGRIQYVPAFLAYIRDSIGITHQTGAVECKVQLTKNFFARKNLPPPFDSKIFQRRAMSNAYLVGSNTALLGRHYQMSLSYLVKAVITDPLNLLYITYKTIRILFSVIMPRTMKNWVRRMFLRLQ